MPIPVITIAQMRAWEAATWASGKTEVEVIERAGQAVARRAEQMTRPGDRLLVLAGKGHNGDDAAQAARHLAARNVELLRVTGPDTQLSAVQERLAAGPALVIDGLFGIGLSRPLSPAWARLLEAVNASGIAVLAVDVPSGLNADTGEPMGGAIQAMITATLGAPKPGLVATAAARWVGHLEVVPDIGLVACPHQAELNWTLPADFAGYPPPRPAASHKGTYGHLLILAGSTGYHGAACLAARGATRARPGLVTLWTPPEVYVPIAAQLQSVMVHPWTAALRAPATTTALLMGPGLASPDLPAGLKETVVELWQTSPWPMVVDASALDWLPAGPVSSKALRLVTPHPGEAARLLQSTAAQVQADRPAALRELSRRWANSWVVLKGHQSLVGRADGHLFLNPSGNPCLAQGGSGDALAGYLGGLLAQPTLQVDPLRTIRYGVWQHGATADLLQGQQPNWTVEDLVAALGNPLGAPASWPAR